MMAIKDMINSFLGLTFITFRNGITGGRCLVDRANHFSAPDFANSPAKL